jgi:thymidylate kinase
MNANGMQYYPENIIFFGPDGAGKTTLAQLLVKHLMSNGHRSRTAWIRGRHSLAFKLATFFTKLGYYRVIKSPNGCVSYCTFDPSLFPRLRKLWELIEFISILPWIITRVYGPKILGYTVVSERYVVDTVVYLAYWLGDDILQSFLSRVLLSFIPRDSVLIHIDAETDVLLARHPDDAINEDYILFQRKAYNTFAKSLKAITIDTTSCGVEENFLRIIQHLNTMSHNG